MSDSSPLPSSIPATAFVVFNHGAFGGAAKKYTNLFLYLNSEYPGKFFYFVNNHLLNQIQEIYHEFPMSNVRIIDFTKSSGHQFTGSPIHRFTTSSSPRYYKDTVPDPYELDRKTWLPRKLYWYLKNFLRQFRLYKQIETQRKELGIKVFVGIFAGMLPLYFYLNKSPRKAAVIFCDMDSWFTDVLHNMKKLWYRKYFSFNYALENSDIIDFLSPMIHEGVKERGVKLNEDNAAVAPCSFADYSKCKVGDKSEFSIAFASRLEPDKNPMLYLEAAKEILQKHPKLKFYLLGEGTLVNEINDFINANDLSGKVIFQFHKNPPEIFAETSVFVSMQTHTNYPSQSVLEAMACGNAIIASDVPDTRLFINEENGILIPLEAAALVTALDRLISNPDLGRRLGENARNFVLENHTVEKYSEYYIGLIFEANSKVFQ